jgi:hypothetical protein
MNLEDLLGARSISPSFGSFVSPAFGAGATGMAFYAPSGPRVAALAGAIGVSSVAATYTLYSIAGIPYGSRGFLWF